MKKLFVDTSAWVALADPKDDNHTATVLFRNQVARSYRWVISNYILDELYTLLLMNAGYRETVSFKQKLDTLVQKGAIELVWISEELANEAWTIFERFNPDKLWSFTDCVSYAVMKQQGITEAFTFDHHFSQMGFIRCP